MLFYVKQHAQTAVLTMIGLLLLSNAWAGLRNIPLGDSVWLDLPTVIAVIMGLALSASIDGMIYLGNWVVGFRPFLNAFDASFGKLFAQVSIPAIFTGGMLAALGEETFFRGILQAEWGLLPVAVIFALAHAGRGLNLLTAWALIEGLLFGWLYQTTGNLFVPMVVHGFHDTAGMFFGRFLYKRFIPPADTLYDWVHKLTTSTAPAAPAPGPTNSTPQADE